MGVVVAGIEGGADKAAEIVTTDGQFSVLELALEMLGTQEQAAAKLGWSPSKLNRILHEKRIGQWPIEDLEKIEALTKIPVERIRKGSPNLPLPKAQPASKKARRAPKPRKTVFLSAGDGKGR